MTDTNRRFLLTARPDGMPKDSDFALVDAPLPELQAGEFLIRNHYASLDPAIRGWLDDVPSYLPPVALGDPVRATTVGIVEESKAEGFKPGDWVMGLNGIERYSVGKLGGFTQPIDVSLVPSPTNFLSVMGAVGLTAYFGVTEILQPKSGQTLLVSGAAGAVGSLVGQLGKRAGCRVIGIAGGPAKCARLIDDYGFDAAIDYRGKDAAALSADIGAAAPDGIDLVFENVGGVGLDATLDHLNQFAKVALCGLISEYNSEHYGTRNLWQLIVHSATIRGFLISEFLDRFVEGGTAMAKMAAEGTLRFDEHIEEGIDNALPAFLRLFEGSNQGKMILKLI
ncbi:MAG: NADP-dependent oxidoreductase [Sphingobium sp.]|uniref:NADP-dependent oxidoreductase n=1 Tax=Sphingobium sp. CECT 9361 TaxID=2845384 RepID=UPI001E5C4D04|nr:NADP-dependent oxidoreductase [Sphingobium sp. CECT 9361]CAH0353689.1 Putative NADP-dependent oxidoreductase YfmJ [Sphingobium sp. CECT 9361]